MWDLLVLACGSEKSLLLFPVLDPLIWISHNKASLVPNPVRPSQVGNYLYRAAVFQPEIRKVTNFACS